MPFGLHWCIALPAVAPANLGEGGHPAKGDFLPPVPYPRRMWASSSIPFHKSPRLNTPLARTSTIADIVLKKSTASGPLIFVHVDHIYTQRNEQHDELTEQTRPIVLVEERQTLVYRQPAAFKKAAPQADIPATNAMDILPNSTLLSRYCGLTFNSHRIHYDHKYATQTEGYPDLVVQGPLMATLLMNFAQANRPGCLLKRFEFRGVAPAFVDQGLQLLIRDSSGESLQIRNEDGALVMFASAIFSGSDC